MIYLASYFRTQGWSVSRRACSILHKPPLITQAWNIRQRASQFCIGCIWGKSWIVMASFSRSWNRYNSRTKAWSTLVNALVDINAQAFCLGLSWHIISLLLITVKIDISKISYDFDNHAFSFQFLQWNCQVDYISMRHGWSNSHVKFLTLMGFECQESDITGCFMQAPFKEETVAFERTLDAYRERLDFLMPQVTKLEPKWAQHKIAWDSGTIKHCRYAPLQAAIQIMSKWMSFIAFICPHNYCVL